MSLNLPGRSGKTCELRYAVQPVFHLKLDPITCIIQAERCVPVKIFFGHRKSECRLDKKNTCTCTKLLNTSVRACVRACGCVVYAFPSTNTSTPTLVPTQPLFQWLPGFFPWGIQNDPWRRPPTSAEVENQWSYTSNPLLALKTCTGQLCVFNLLPSFPHCIHFYLVWIFFFVLCFQILIIHVLKLDVTRDDCGEICLF